MFYFCFWSATKSFFWITYWFGRLSLSWRQPFGETVFCLPCAKWPKRPSLLTFFPLQVLKTIYQFFVLWVFLIHLTIYFMEKYSFGSLHLMSGLILSLTLYILFELISSFLFYSICLNIYINVSSWIWLYRKS